MPATDPAPQSEVPHDPFRALRVPSYRLYLAGNITAVVGMQMQSVVVGWEVYQRTHSAFYLALVGLVQVVPVFALTLVVGYIADRFDRRRVLIAALGIISLSAIGLAVVSYRQGPLAWFFFFLFLSAVGRCFQQPVKNSLMPLIVPREAFSNAVTWSMGAFQLSSIFGPLLGSWGYALFGRAAPVYAFDALAAAGFAIILTQVVLWREYHKVDDGSEESQGEIAIEERERMTLSTLVEGVKFVWRRPVILGALSLDMFAVLFGGATNLFPIFARDVFFVGETGLGWMRTAPAVGSLLMSIILAVRPPLRYAGRSLLLAVIGFGLATIVFGISRSFAVALAMLFLTGVFDIVSVIVRHTLVQVLTPDRMRGRVSAVNSMFISASNELGEFESGLAATFFQYALAMTTVAFMALGEESGGFAPGLVRSIFLSSSGVATAAMLSVVSGGVGTIVVVLVVAVLNPKLRNYGKLDAVPDEMTLEMEEEERVAM